MHSIAPLCVECKDRFQIPDLRVDLCKLKSSISKSYRSSIQSIYASQPKNPMILTKNPMILTYDWLS